MVWPANRRGVPDATRKVGDVSSPLVFETLKNDWEVFQPAGGAPSAWDDSHGEMASSDRKDRFFGCHFACLTLVSSF
jgi:hypothetical protein